MNVCQMCEENICQQYLQGVYMPFRSSANLSYFGTFYVCPDSKGHLAIWHYFFFCRSQKNSNAFLAILCHVDPRNGGTALCQADALRWVYLQGRGR